jgi:hypothetical protein
MDAMGEAVVARAVKVTGPSRPSFDDVYDAERRAIVRLAALLVGSQAIAEELAQDAFLRLFERFDNVDNPPGFHGRSVVVSPEGGRVSLPNQDVLERVANSLALTSATDLEDLRAEVDGRIAELPVLASAETSIGTIDVPGDGEFVRLCLRRSDLTEPGCNTTPYGSGRSPGGTALASAEWTVDGTWSVAVASQGDHPSRLSRGRG